MNRRSTMPIGSRFALVCLPLTLIGGCAGTAREETESGGDAITSQPESPVKDQVIGNCWLYATAGWAEAAVLATNPRDSAPDYSESYWSYWHWYDQITSEAWYTSLTFGWFGVNDLQVVTTGGWFETSVKLIRRRGLVDETSFPTGDPNQAQILINRSLLTGALSTRSARRDHALVRAELDRAWRISAGTAAALDAVFDATGDRTLDDLDDETFAALRQSTVRRAADVPVRVKDGADTLGEMAYGRRAWTYATYPEDRSERRAYQKRFQRALHDGYSLPMTWYVPRWADDWSLLTGGADRRYHHASLLTNYGAEQVPGFGVLPVGKVESRPEALAAALDDRAVVAVIRVKNSWGVEIGDKGYMDLARGYFDGKEIGSHREGDEWVSDYSVTGLTGVFLPPGY